MKGINCIARLAAIVALAAMVSAGQTAHAQKTAPKAKFSAEQATAVALKKYPGKVVGKVPLENEPQPLFQYLILHLRMLQLVLIRVELAAHRGQQRRLQMCFQLLEKFRVGRCSIGRSGRCERGESRTHDAY